MARFIIIGTLNGTAGKFGLDASSPESAKAKAEAKGVIVQQVLQQDNPQPASTATAVANPTPESIAPPTFTAQQNQMHVHVEQAPKNSLGTAGFVVSLIGWFFGGLLCPVGFVMSLIALQRQPKGFAIAGTIIGGIGSLGGIVVAILIAAFIIGASTIAITAANIADVMKANVRINKVYTNTGSLPSESKGNQILADNGLDLAKYKYETTGATTYTITNASFDGRFGTTDDIKYEHHLPNTLMP